MIPSCALNLIAAGKVSSSAMTTLVGITSFVKASDRTAEPYIETVAIRTGQSSRTVSRHVAQLVEARLLRVYKTMRGPSFYEVVDPCGSCFRHAKIPKATAPVKARNMASESRQQRPDPMTDLASADDRSDVSHIGTKSIELNPSDQIGATDEIEAHQRIDEQVDRAINEGNVTSPVAYRKAAHANPDDIAAHTAEIRRQRKIHNLEDARDNCPRCDGMGRVWTNRSDEVVPPEHIDAWTAHRCHHGAEVVADRDAIAESVRQSEMVDL
ncbi:MAG: hypothetical protein IH943_11335 [Acidobacteria bacterium]|nr:hypothetical protein [Acidobacteriota bacterium]